MNLSFDINSNNDVYASIWPDQGEDEEELHNLSQKLFITNPCKDINNRDSHGAFNHLSDVQHSIYLSKIRRLYHLFKPNGSLSYRPIGLGAERSNIFLLLESIINAYMNEFDDYCDDTDDEADDDDDDDD